MSRDNGQRFFAIGFNVFTILLWGWLVLEFLTKGATHISESIADLYLVSLSFYAGDKEIRRWRHRHRSTQRRGEYFVIGWVLTLFVFLIIEMLDGIGVGYRIPRQMPLVVGGVVIIYFITQYLKSEYLDRK